MRYNSSGTIVLLIETQNEEATADLLQQRRDEMMTDIKRYDEHPDGGGMREDVLGGYVKFADVKDEIARLKSALDIADREYIALSEELAQAAEKISATIFQVKDFNGSWSDIGSGDTVEWQARGRVVRQLIEVACVPACIADGDIEKWLFSHPEKDAEMEKARLSLYAFRAAIAKATS